MDLLKKRILEDGKAIGENIIKVDEFLNHQVDPVLMNEIGKEFKRLFDGSNITKILTIEASGIAIGAFVALHFGVQLVFAKKTKSLNIDDDVYSSSVYSFTKKTEYDVKVSRKYLSDKDNILIVDDFLANGRAALGLVDIATQAGANIEGIGIVIEKGFQEGGQILRDKGFRVESLAVIDHMGNGEIKFKS